MPLDNQAIIEVLYKTAGVNDVKAGTKAVKETDDAAKGVNKTVKDTANTHANALGMNRREWMRTGSEAAFYARTALGSLGAVDKGLTQSIGLATQLGESFMFGGIVGVTMAAASTAIGFIIGEMQKAEQAAKKALESYEKFAKTLSDLDKLSSPLAQTMREQYNVTKEQAIAMAALAESNVTYRAAVAARNAEDERMVRTGQALGEAKKRLAQLEIEQTMAMGTGSAVGDEYNAVMDAQRTIIANLTAELTKLSGARQDDIAAMTEQAAKSVVLYSRKRTLAQEERADINMLLYLQDEQAKKTKLQEDAIYSLARAQRDLLSGMIEKSLTPTSVTQKDLDDTKAGKYKDKWDEVRRRFEAIAGGGGAEFDAEAAQLKRLGLSASEAAEGFKDFSLFANDANLELINFPALETDVEKQIDSLLGKQKVMGKAFKEIYDKMPQAKKDALRELGVTKLSDLEKKSLGLADDIVLTPKQSDDFISNLQKYRKDIEALLGGDVTVKIIYEGSNGGTATASTVPTLSGMSGGADTEAYAEGGNRRVTRSGMVWVDRGEEFWASGTRNQVAPPRGGPLVGQVVVNNQQDAQRLINDIARRVRINR